MKSMSRFRLCTFRRVCAWRLLHETGAAFEPHLCAFEQVVGDSPESLNTETMHWIPSLTMQRFYVTKNQPYSGPIPA